MEPAADRSRKVTASTAVPGPHHEYSPQIRPREPEIEFCLTARPQSRRREDAFLEEYSTSQPPAAMQTVTTHFGQARFFACHFSTTRSSQERLKHRTGYGSAGEPTGKSTSLILPIDSPSRCRAASRLASPSC